MVRTQCMKCIWISNPSNMFGYRPGLLLADFKFQTTKFAPFVPTGPIIPSNPDRFAMLWWVHSGGQYQFGWQDNNLSIQDFPFTVVNSPVYLNFLDYGPLIGLPWFAVSVAGGITSFVTEIIYQPKGGESFAAKISQLAELRQSLPPIPQSVLLQQKSVMPVPTG